MLLFVWVLLMATLTHAQTAKSDIITKMNGEEASGKVTEINESSVKFVHDGESLVYTISKSDIFKITFGSGRTEFFNKQASGSLDHRNKVAILPFSYLIDKQDAGEAMTYQVQNEAYAYLQKNAAGYQVQDPANTNALLAKSGVTAANLRGYTMTELCDVLGVEFIITGSIRQDRTSTNTYQSANSSYDSKSKSSGGSTGRGTATGSSSGSTYSGSYATTSQSYQTNMTMNVFNDSGKNVFSQSHNSFWALADAYVTTLHFLLKKTPFITK